MARSVPDGASMNPVKVGDKAPQFEATTSDGQQISLADFQGKQAVVIFFYPKDNTSLCTQQACSFRDAYEDFVKLGAVVIGISSDSDESHRSFATTHRLPYLLIADPAGSLRRLFGVPNALFVIPGRVTYVIDREGIVRMIFNSSFVGSGHVDEALKALRELTIS
jgi:peroxiredoxin Q/BCP